MRLLRAREPLESALRDPSTPPALRATLALIPELRKYAEAIGLEPGARYAHYVDWPGDRILTNIVATRPHSLTPAGFWFPWFGRLPYKGYFDAARAEHEAARLAEQGFDVCVSPVRAYSTLGWFDDPLTRPMLELGEGRFVETFLHELVHGRVYLPRQADFSEGLAQFFGQEASVDFYRSRGAAAAAERRRLEIEEERALDRQLLDFRRELETLYASALPSAAIDARRRDAEAALRERIAAQPATSWDPARLAAGLRLNDACLALSATYTSDLPALVVRFDAGGRDLAAFLGAAIEAADQPDPRAHFLAGP